MAIQGGLLLCKLLESRNKADFQTAISISLFYNFYTLFYFPGFFSTIVILTNIAFSIGIFLLIQSEKLSFKAGAKSISKIILLALPITVICFFIFPRIPVNFWQFKVSDRGLTGFSEEFRIDDIKNLALNSETAFRVNFFSNIPERKNLYWRGITFEDFDGRYWRYDRTKKSAAVLPVLSEAVEYQIILEPHGKRWLFALDWPSQKPDNNNRLKIRSRMLSDYTLRTDKPITRSHTYQLASVYSDDEKIPGEINRSKNLAIPSGFNPKTQELGSRLKKQHKEDRAILNAALSYYASNQFRYSLRPLPLGRNSIDDFLFKTRIGYCEHYASSLVFLLRSAGVPARIVGGYLGGEFNELGNYLIVRQSDAHVWVEVRLNGQWQRVDPTAYVAPDRILSAADAITGEDIPYLRNKLRFGRFYDVWNQLYLRIDALDFAWTSFVESYDYSKQKELLSFLGVDLTNKITLSFFIIINIFILAFLIFFAYRWVSKERNNDPLLRAYGKFLNKLIKKGIIKPSYLSATQLAELITNSAVLSDQQKKQAIEICKLYSKISYEKLTAAEQNLAKNRLFMLINNLKLS